MPARRCLLHVSNFRPVKRVLDVVRIFERVAREVDSVLLMVGEAGARLGAGARRAGSGSPTACASWASRQSDRGDRRASPTVFLLPSGSSRSGPPRSEAMARAACRSWAPTPGGLPEVVRHAESGYLLPVGDVDGMAARTDRDPEGRRAPTRDGPGARQRVEVAVRGRRVVGQYEAVYNRVLGADMDAFDIAAHLRASRTTPSLHHGRDDRAAAAVGRRIAMGPDARRGARGTPETSRAEAQRRRRSWVPRTASRWRCRTASLSALPDQKDVVVERCGGCGRVVVLLQHWLASAIPITRLPVASSTTPLPRGAAQLPPRTWACRSGPTKLVYAATMTEANDIRPSFVVDVTAAGRRRSRRSPRSRASSRPQPGETGAQPLDRFREAVELTGRRQRPADRRALRRGLRHEGAARGRRRRDARRGRDRSDGAAALSR